MEHQLKHSILFICTGNSCRSQMAEGWARHLKSNILEPYSAGIEKHGLDPLAIQVMAERGVDISKQQSKHLNDLKKKDFDYVITICNDLNEKCPVFRGKTKRIHHSFDDPTRLAKLVKSQEEKLSIYRRIRDEIKDFIEKLSENLSA